MCCARLLQIHAVRRSQSGATPDWTRRRQGAIRGVFTSWAGGDSIGLMTSGNIRNAQSRGSGAGARLGAVNEAFTAARGAACAPLVGQIRLMFRLLWIKVEEKLALLYKLIIVTSRLAGL